MNKIIVGLATAALLTAGPALAGDKKVKNEASNAAGAQSAEVGRGGLKEWPVSKEEADWSSAAASGSASTGASSGASGSDADSKASKR